ncbi:MAG: M1 family aminopeptidase [Ignavibacteria bacterium]
MKTILFIILISVQAFAQEILSYNLDVKINVKEKTILVKGFIDIDFKDKDSVTFILWKNSSIYEINSSNAEIKYEFDTASASPMYMPNGKNLVLSKTSESNSKQSILFGYKIDAGQIKGWAKSFTEDWIELNLYSAWFPVYWGDFTAKILVHIDEGYGVTGAGVVSKKEDHWELLKPWRSYDNVVIAAKNLKSKTLQENSVYIQTDYSSTGFSDSDADSVVTECKYVMNMFQNLFGKTDSTYLKFIIAPFEQGGGYSRKNYVRMGTKDFNLYTRGGIAHEIAHFWWHNADATTWEDWLNEAFAEYSMLLYVRERLGLEEFQKIVNEYKNRTGNLSPVWGIDRNANDAYSVLYEKGSLILCEMEEMIGKTVFLNFLKEVSAGRIAKTEDLLNLMEKILTKEIRLELENKLKS